MSRRICFSEKSALAKREFAISTVLFTAGSLAFAMLVDSMKRDVVMIGGSAGSIDGLRVLIGNLPADLAAVVCVIVHMAPRLRSELVKVLDCAHTLPAVEAEEGMRLEPGRIYAAAPDRHLIVADGHIHLSRGPK